MNESYLSTIESIAYLEYRVEEYLEKLHLLEMEIINECSYMTMNNKLELISMVEALKARVRDLAERRIVSVKRNSSML